MRGNTVNASSVSTHSRMNMTTVSETRVPICSTAMTSTLEGRWASRLMSFMIRDMRSAEWTPEKKASDMRWMWV